MGLLYKIFPLKKKEIEEVEEEKDDDDDDDDDDDGGGEVEEVFIKFTRYQRAYKVSTTSKEKYN